MGRFQHGRMGQWRETSVSTRRFRPSVESLEERLAPAVIEWDGGAFGTGTNWCDAVNWIGDRLPGPSDSAVIGAAFSARTIRTDCVITVRGLNTAAAIEVVSNVFSVAYYPERSLAVLDSLFLIGPDGTLRLDNANVRGAGRIDNTGTLELYPYPNLIEMSLNNRGRMVVYITPGDIYDHMITGNFVNEIDGSLRIEGRFRPRAGMINHGLIEFATRGQIRETPSLINEGRILVSGVSGLVYVRLFENRGTVEVASGWLGVFMPGGTVLNNGGIHAIGGDILLQREFDYYTNLANNGLIQVASGRTINVEGNLTNIVSNTLTGGEYDIAGRLFVVNADIGTNAANIVLNGPGIHFANHAGQSGFRNLRANAKTGSLTLRNGASLSTAAFTNAGYVAIEGDTSLVVRDDYRQLSGGSTFLAGGNLGTNTTGSVVVGENSYFGGWGAVRGNFVNHGTIDVGGSGLAGLLTVLGNFEQSATGNLVIELGGNNPGIDYDYLDIRYEEGFTGTATLGGTLAIRLFDGYLPVPDDLFLPFCAKGGISGDFDSFDGLVLSDTLALMPFHDGACYYLWSYAF